MSYFIDVSIDSINKYGEELCGDNVEMVKLEDGVIIVMADGLGSGVKANILATLTSKIAATMLKDGVSIDETVDTIIHTLPVCGVRKLAYSTFTIIRVYNDGRVYAVEYDNPPMILIEDNNRIINIKKKQIEISGRMINETYFILKPNDVLTIISDGVAHAGVGAVLNLGWKWENVAEYLMEIAKKEKCSKNITQNLIGVCRALYGNKPGDDSTVVTVRLRHHETIDLFTGPPKNRDNDQWVVKKLMGGKGKKVVCGGTTANIVARELKEELKMNLNFVDSDVPPTASIKGIDLVTEGVLTLSKAVEMMKDYAYSSIRSYTKGNRIREDAASRLVKMLVEDCTHLNLWVGTAVNPAHQNPDFPVGLSIKVKVIEELEKIMKNLGKEVEIQYL
jgi:hypothetical protein